MKKNNKSVDVCCFVFNYADTLFSIRHKFRTNNK